MKNRRYCAQWPRPSGTIVAPALDTMAQLRHLVLCGSLILCLPARPVQAERLPGQGEQLAVKASPWAARASLRVVARRAGRELRPNLKRHAAHLRQRFARQGREEPLDELVDQANKRFLRRYAARLMRIHGQVNPRVLPATLPLLPATDNAALQRLIDRGIARTRTAKDLYLYLERQTSVLKGSSDPGQQAQGRTIAAYLDHYKKQHGRDWVDRLLVRALPAGQIVRVPKVTFRSRGRPSDIQWLPALWPATDNSPAGRAVQQLFDQARPQTDGTNKGLYVNLEQKVGELRRSGQRELAGHLRSFLDRYRADLVSKSARSELKRRVTQAWGILNGLVEPALLRRLPEVQMEVTPFFAVPGIVTNQDGSKKITLLPNSSVKDILHELGHLVEDYGGVGPLAASHALVTQRAYGARPVWLGKVIPRTSYDKQQRALEGGFLDPYMGRHYPQGWTEILSTGLERMHSTNSALRFLERDGYHFLLVNSTLQRRPVPPSAPTTRR